MTEWSIKHYGIISGDYLAMIPATERGVSSTTPIDLAPLLKSIGG